MDAYGFDNMDFSFQALIQRHNAEMSIAFRLLVDTLVRNSKLSISLLRISNVTEDSFHATLEARITRTGPAKATITPMTVDLCGPAGRFGNVTLPAIETQSNGTDIEVTNQLISIVDKDALKAFIHGVIQDGSAVLSLRNGQTTMSALGVGPRDIVYEKEIDLPGMRGPVVSVRAASLVPKNTDLSESPSMMTMMMTMPGMTMSSMNSAAPLIRSSTTASMASTAGLSGGSAISVVFHVANPSPLEISFGICFFEIQNHEGALVAELKGHLDIRRDSFEAAFQGNVNKAAAAKLAADVRRFLSPEGKGGKGGGAKEKGGKPIPEARLVGRRCAGAGWCDETIKGINVPLQNVENLFQALD